MRILAIRGKNLASLAVDFEVLLEQGVLQHAGLFAITGSTGAGKSTILDALCLALYDQMPRLPEGHGVAIGHKDEDDVLRIKSHDVSSILRRGTASAYAEVDFIGQDKNTYRARWEIIRARGNVKGRLQAQKMSLQNLHSLEKIGQGKKETQAEIVARIGLNFDQFRRSVLLAQGDFAAFLKAKKDERSSLLEKITGTDIYSDLSITTFERAKYEKQLLDSILEKLADKVPLAVQTRAELEKEKHQIGKQLAALQQDLKENQKIIAWYNRQALLKKDQKDTQGHHQTAQAQWNSHAADRELLQQIEQAQSLRPLLQLEQSLEQEWQDAENKLKENQHALSTAEKILSTATESVSVANQEFARARQDHIDAQPLLVAARKLDTQIDDCKIRLAKMAHATAAQHEIWQTALTAHNSISRQKDQQESQFQQLAIWLEQHTDIQQLALEWARWEAVISQYIKLDKEFQQDKQALAILQSNISQQKSKLQELHTKSTQTQAEKNALSLQLAMIEKQVLELPLSQIHNQKSQLESDQDMIATALMLVEKVLEERSRMQQDQVALTKAESSILKANAQIKHLQELQTIKQIQLQEAQQAYNLMQAASEKSAEDLRSLLQDQQPCPVCGAQQHPWAGSSQAVQQPLSEQQKRLSKLQTEKEQLITNLSAQLTVSKQTEKEQLDLISRIAEAHTLQQNLLQEWLLIALDKKPDWAEIQTAYVIHLTQQNNLIKTEYTSVKKREAEALKQQNKLNALRSQFDQLSQLSISQTAVLAELDRELAENHSSCSAKKEALQRLEIEQKNILALLNTPLKQISNWHDRLIQEGDIFLQKLSTDVSLWQQKSTQQTVIQEQLQQLEKQMLTTDADHNYQQKQYVQYRDDLERQTAQLESLKVERKRYFNGALANDCVIQINQQLQKAEVSLQQAKDDWITANTEIKTCNSSILHSLEESKRRADKKNIAVEELAKALVEHQMSKPGLQQLLSKDCNWIANAKSKSQELAKVLQESQVALNVKTESLQAHESDTPKTTEQDVQEQINQLVEQQDKLNKEKENNNFALRTDDEKITSGKALQQQLQTQQQCWEKWESLNELIGSSSGQKFRIFAQSLTLETLLSYTNRHLQVFARRYHLQRVPGSDLELQVVDRDMADEVRSVYSLSGGESFLVSLALALGLASLSSNKTQVESLFIDEGFGSLDTETLDIAIASLDTLQSLGRKVGVISHVPVLVERIGTQVLVKKLGGGQSVVSTRAV